MDSLPSEENPTDEHEKRLLELDDERAKCAKELEKVVEHSELISGEVSSIISSLVEVEMVSRPRVA